MAVLLSSLPHRLKLTAVAMAPDMKEILAEQAATPVAQPVDEFNAEVKKDFAFWQRLAKEVNLQAE